jgi:hypothetical protein
MPHKSLARALAGLTLLAALVLSTATPALAFDGRGGQNVTIPAGEVVNDDLYITAQTVVVDGTIKGDLVVFASNITINGTVDGELIAAGQDVIINGTVNGDVRIAGAALEIGEKAVIGGDLVGAGASLETRPGSSIARDAVFGGGQSLLAGKVGRNGLVATGGLELSGTINGNLTAYVGNPDQSRGGSPSRYMAGTGLTIPSVETGLTIDPTGKILGNLKYTSAKEVVLPAGAVSGTVTHILPKPGPRAPAPMTPLQLAINAALDVVRLAVTLIVFGLLLGWLFPGQIKSATERIKNAPWPSLGGGILSIAAFCFSLAALFVAIIIGAILFGVLTLGSLTATVIFGGLLAMFALILGFVLVVAFVAQVIVGTLAGQLILSRFSAELAANKYWPMVLGVVLYALLVSIPVIGVLVWLVVMLFGLGVVWHFARQRMERKPVLA